MDDFNFDDYIRKRMENYEASSFSTGAFSQLHGRLAARYAVQRHVKYRVLLATMGTLILSTLLNIYFINPNFFQHRKQSSITPHASRVIDSLNLVIKKLTREQPKESYIISPTGENNGLKTRSVKAAANKVLMDDTTQYLKLFLGSTADLPGEFFSRLRNSGMIGLDGNQVWLVISNQKPDDRVVDYRRNDIEVPALRKTISPVVNMKLPIPTSKSHVEISARMRASIEKHYFKGIGIDVAPHGDFLVGHFEIGSGRLVPRIGFTADWIMSPRLSVETEVNYSTPKFTISKSFERLGLHNDSEIGTLQSAEIAVRTFSSPVNAKFRWWLTEKEQFIFRLGFSPYFAFRREYVHNYSPPNQNTESDLIITTIEQNDEKSFWGSTLTASAGITRALKDKRKIEASLYFENSLGDMGAEKVGVRMWGMRTAYWFKAR